MGEFADKFCDFQTALDEYTKACKTLYEAETPTEALREPFHTARLAVVKCFNDVLTALQNAKESEFAFERMLRELHEAVAAANLRPMRFVGELKLIPRE